MPCIAWHDFRACPWPCWTVHCHRVICSGADPGFEKGGGTGASGNRTRDILGQFGGFFKEFGTKRGGCVLAQKGVGVPPPPPLWIRACC